MNPGNRYTRLAKKPINPRLNNGTIAGGLAHALESGLKGYAVYKADQEAKAKKEQTETRLAAALNEFLPAPQATKDLADDPLAAGGAPTQAGYDTRSLAAMLMDPATAPVGQAMFAQMTKGPGARKTERDAAGYLRFVDDGTRVFPDVETKPDRDIRQVYGVGTVDMTDPQNPVVIMPEGKRAPSMSVNVNSGVQQKKEDEAFGSLLVKGYEGILEASENARNMLGFISQAQAINENELPSSIKLKAGNIITAMGFNPETVPGFENISNGQQFAGVIGNVVLTKLSAQKGPQTDRDAKRIEQTVASLGNTPEARRFLLDSARAMAEMEILREQHWRSHKTQTGSFAGASDTWDKSLGGQRIVGRNKVSGQVVFLPQFIDAVQRENPDATLTQILDLWGSYE